MLRIQKNYKLNMKIIIAFGVIFTTRLLYKVNYLTKIINKELFSVFNVLL